jgi:hypothetical protein
MRFARFWPALVVAVALGAFAPAAQAVTLQELVALSRAGLPDEVLVALIEVEARVFPIDADTLKWLHEAGLSPRLIEAIVRSGRSRRVEAGAEPLAAPDVPAVSPVPVPPSVVVIEREAPPVVVTVPVYVAVPVAPVVSRRVAVRRSATPAAVVSTGFGGVPVSTGFGAARPVHLPPSDPPAPVYWGWGGQLRPDAWKPAWDAKPPKP